MKRFKKILVLVNRMIKKIQSAIHLILDGNFNHLISATKRYVLRSIISKILQIEPTTFYLQSPTKINRIKEDDRTYGNIVLPARRHLPWFDDTDFLDSWKIATEYSMLDIVRAYEIWKAIEQVKYLEGCLVEIGCNKGGTGCMMAKKASLLDIDENVYLCDTFSGVTKSSDKDNTYSGGEHSNATPGDVKRIANKLNVDPIILPGIFPDETSDSIDEDNIRMAHIDVDVYLGTEQSFSWLWEHLSIGGVIIIDDVGNPRTAGVTKFYEEISQREKFSHYCLMGHAIIVKTGG